MKTILTKEFNTAAISGVAELTDSQKRSIEFSQNSVRLRPDLTYVIMPQYVHKEKLAAPINGNEYSNKLFVIGVDADGNAVEATTLSLNGLRSRHYGVVGDTPLKVLAEPNELGLLRVARGTDSYSVFSVGSVPVKLDGNKAYIYRPFAFKVKGRNKCYTVNFERKDNGYSAETFTEDNKLYVKFISQTYNDYEEVSVVPTVDWEGLLPEAKEFSQNLPK